MSLPYQAAESFLRNQDQIVSVLSETSKLLAEPSIYERIREDIKAMTIFSVDKVDSVNFFGSRFIGLGTEESDLDIFIKVGKDSFAKTKKSQSDFIRYEKAFKDQENWLVEKTVPSASIPIITCIYLPLRLHCDISFLHGLSTFNSKLLAHLFAIQPEAVKLFHFVREWMKTQEFFVLKGYSVTLLVLFYLQQQGLMPSVRDVQRNVKVTKLGGFETQFDPTRSISDYNVGQMINFKDHTRNFFLFYADFDYNQVISTFLGREVSKYYYRCVYPKFIMKGVLLPGPLKQMTNSQIINDDELKSLIDLCRLSSDFLHRYHLSENWFSSASTKTGF